MKYRFPIIILSLLGFADAVYLTANHYLNASTICFELTRCDLVLQSQYATIFGIPIALLGAIYYLAAALVAWQSKNHPSLSGYLRILVTLGLIISAGLIYLQLFVIRAICLYCMLSAAISLALFLTVYLGERRAKLVNQNRI